MLHYLIFPHTEYEGSSRKITSFWVKNPCYMFCHLVGLSFVSNHNLRASASIWIRTLVPITEDFIFCEEQHLYIREFYVHILLSCILNITANKISKCTQMYSKERQTNRSEWLGNDYAIRAQHNFLNTQTVNG